MSSNEFHFDISHVSQSSTADRVNQSFVFSPLDTQFFSHQDHQNAFNIDYGTPFVPQTFSEISSYTSVSLDQEYLAPLPTTEASFPSLQHSPYVHIASPATCSNSQSPNLVPATRPDTITTLTNDQQHPEVYTGTSALFKSMKSPSHGSENSPQSIHSMPLPNICPRSSSPEPGLDQKRRFPLHATVPTTPATTPLHVRKDSLSTFPRQKHVESTGRKQPVPILPNPDGPFPVTGQKRSESEAEITPDIRPAKLRRGSSLSPSNIELKEEELMLHHFRGEGCSWKETADRMHKETGQQLKVPALQMRLKRFYEKLREWSDADEQALRQAVDRYHNKQWDIICSFMTEFGATEKWDAKQCKKKWLELSHFPEYSSSLPLTPIYTQSPIEGPGHSFYFPAFSQG